MKKLLFLTLLLCGCGATTHYKVELPYGVSGFYLPCGNDLDCELYAAGVCKNGYRVAETMSHLEFPHTQAGIVIVCE